MTIAIGLQRTWPHLEGEPADRWSPEGIVDTPRGDIR